MLTRVIVKAVRPSASSPSLCITSGRMVSLPSMMTTSCVSTSRMIPITQRRSLAWKKKTVKEEEGAHLLFIVILAHLSVAWFPDRCLALS
jgi:hypothetical protein